MSNRAGVGRRLKSRIVAGVAFAFLCGTSAFAQAPQPQGPSRAFRGLFGGNESDSESRTALDFNFSLYGGYDRSTYTDLVRAIDNPFNPAGPPLLVFYPVYQQAGFYGGAQAGLDYRRRGNHVSFEATGGSGYRYYSYRSSLNGTTPWESLGLSGSLGTRTTFSLGQGAFYSPYYGFGVFPGLSSFSTPGQTFLSTADYSLYPSSVITYTADASLTRRLSQRSSLSFQYVGRLTDFLNDPRSLLDQRIGARYSRSATQNFGYHLGYAYRRGTYGNIFFAGRPIQGHDLDVGVDYNRALDRTRRTTFGFSTGTTVTVTSADSYYNVLATAYLNRDLGRTWNVRADYRRGLQFVQGFDRPFFTDTVALSTSGYLGRRVDVSASAAYSNGALGLGAAGEGFGTYTGTARLQFAVSRYVALYTEGFYYYYLFDQGAVLQPGIPRGLDRRSVRGGLNLFLPLLR